MLQGNRLSIAALLFFTAGATLNADVTLTCTAPGFSVTYQNAARVQCAFPADPLLQPNAPPPSNPTSMLAFTSTSFSGNTATEGSSAFLVNSVQNSSGPYPETATATWSLALFIPDNPNSSDILKIVPNTSGLASTYNLTVGSFSWTTACDAHYGCFPTSAPPPNFEITLPPWPGGVWMTDSGRWSFQVTEIDEQFPGEINATEADTLFQVSRFLADGVTPDPFTTTPEPASAALLATGLGALLWASRRKRA